MFRITGSKITRGLLCVSPCLHYYLAQILGRVPLSVLKVHTFFHAMYSSGCFPCMTAESRNLIVFSTNSEASFISAGFYNWRKASECFVSMKQAKHTWKLY